MKLKLIHLRANYLFFSTGNAFWQYTSQENDGDRFLLLSVQLYDMLTTGALAGWTDTVIKDIYRHLLKQLEKVMSLLVLRFLSCGLV